MVSVLIKVNDTIISHEDFKSVKKLNLMLYEVIILLHQPTMEK